MVDMDKTALQKRKDTLYKNSLNRLLKEIIARGEGRVIPKRIVEELFGIDIRTDTECYIYGVKFKVTN